MQKKQFKLRAEEIRTLVHSYGYCFATDHITVEGRAVGYLYREQPDSADDSGWRFFSGLESDDYVNSPANIAIYDVNTIANYDPEIIPLLNSAVGVAFVREALSGRFVEERHVPPTE